MKLHVKCFFMPLPGASNTLWTAIPGGTAGETFQDQPGLSAGNRIPEWIDPAMLCEEDPFPHTCGGERVRSGPDAKPVHFPPTYGDKPDRAFSDSERLSFVAGAPRGEAG